MRIVIIGDGKVGHTLATQLIKEGHELTIIDRNEKVLQRSMDELDALVIQGNGVSAATLQEAEAKDADIVIAVTISDEINMLCSLTAKKLGAQYTISRVRDPEYMKSLPFLMKELHIDYVINPERSTALEISRILRYPFAGSVETFARGRVELMDFRVGKEDGLPGIALKDLYRLRHDLPRVLYCLVEREHEAIIPKGDFCFREHDRVFVASDVKTMTAYFSALGKSTLGVHRVMIMGGGRIAYYLAMMLLEMKMAVSIIEVNPERARELSELFPAANVILGDGTDRELLLSEGIGDCDAFITLSGRDEENIMAGLCAVQNGVRKVIVKNNREHYADMLTGVGIDSILSPRQVTANTILRTVRTRSNANVAQAVQRLYRLMDGKVEALEFIVHKEDSFIGIPLKDLRVQDDALIAVIVRMNQVHMPDGQSTLEPEDRVIVINKRDGVTSLQDIIRR
ncbi:MAG: Trk system potassium transporter TrkA [Christensenellales bacterium]